MKERGREGRQEKTNQRRKGQKGRNQETGIY